MILKIIFNSRITNKKLTSDCVRVCANFILQDMRMKETFWTGGKLKTKQTGDKVRHPEIGGNKC